MFQASDLGDAYTELRALRELLFLETSSVFKADGSLAVRVRPSTVRYLMQTECVGGGADMSTFLCMHGRIVPQCQALQHLLSRAPLELASPHQRAGLTASEYVRWLDAASMPPSTPDGEAAMHAHCIFPSPEAVALCEGAVWKRVRACADEYAQRMATTSSEPGVPASTTRSSEAAGQLHPVYRLLVRHGSALVARVEQSVAAAMRE